MSCTVLWRAVKFLGGVTAKICRGGSDKVSEVNAAGVFACRYLGFRLGEVI